MKTTTINNSTSRPPRRCGFFFIALTLACLALSPTARAVDPPPDGGYANFNTAEGKDALFSLTTGDSNTAMGFEALFGNTVGSSDTANGVHALYSNTTGSLNTAIGVQAMESNTTGSYNTAIGNLALLNNTMGDQNTAVGVSALRFNSTGPANTADGYQALFNNTIGGVNTASGYGALALNTSGNFNTAIGGSALQVNSTGNNNAAAGDYALYYSTGNDNTAAGSHALLNSTGNNNTAAGSYAGSNLTTGDNNIDIGNAGVAGEAGIIRIGTGGTQTKTFIAAIRGVVFAGGQPVVVNASGQLGVKGSSARFKEAIKSMDKASESILSLRPVSFRYRKELDPKSEPQFGLIAEEVAKVDSELVVKDEQGKPFSVRYEEVNAMLLNEFLKEHCKVEEQEAAISRLDSAVAAQAIIIGELSSTVAQQRSDVEAQVAQQQKAIQSLTASLKEQASQIEKVSDQVSASQTAPPILVENR